MAGEPTSFSDLRRLAVETYCNEFKELSDSWRSLDTKAQGLGAIAGIFLAAVFARTRDLPSSFGSCERLILAAATLLLVVAVGAAVLALWIGRTAMAPLGQTAEFIDLILQHAKKDELNEAIENFYNDQITVWKKANGDMRKHIPTKATSITCGQGALVIAAMLVAVLAVGSVLNLL